MSGKKREKTGNMDVHPSQSNPSDEISDYKSVQAPSGSGVVKGKLRPVAED